MAKIKLERLSRTFHEGAALHPVLVDLDLSIDHGETIAVTGPSGVGKSTLLNLIGTLDRPTSGRITIDDTMIDMLSVRNRCQFRSKTVGFVFQFHHLLPEFSVEENLLMPIRWNGGDLADASKRARKLLDRVGLLDRKDSSVTVLSGGEAQRVAAIRAIMNRPSLLLADEPTGNLDGENAERLVELLFEFAKETGATLMLATHHTGYAGQCSRLIRLGSGKIMEDVRTGTI